MKQGRTHSRTHWRTHSRTHWRTWRMTGLLPLVLGLAACAGHDESTSDAASRLIVKTDKGAVRGDVAQGVENFLNIPYAAPPTGPLRWAPPRPAAAWSDVRSAQAPGRYCTQPKNFDSPGGAALDEDCLTLNIQRPVGTKAGGMLPVYVYIHGGGFATGSGVRDTQEKIVRLNGVIGVSFNYRLGALGFLALPALAGDDGEVGNYGLLDQQAALRWVQRNVAAFGGDPHRVTIGGESAGGWSVCTHLVAPGSAGLFSQAIIQSGSCISHSLAEAEAAGAKVAAKLGCGDGANAARCVRSKPVSDILAAQDPLYFPTYGTPFLPGDTRDAILSGRFSHVPVLIGSTRDEGRSFTHDAIGWSRKRYDEAVRSSFRRNAAAVLKAYPYPRQDADPAAVAYQLGAIGTDDGALGADDVEHGIGGCGDLALTEALARTVPTWAYEFSHRMGPGWYPTPGYAWGAGHAAELTYLYPQHEGGKTYAGFTTSEHGLSDQMVRYWGAFISRADPNLPGQAAWDAYAPGDRMLSLDVDGGTAMLSKAAFRTQHRCAFWDRLAGASVIRLPSN